MCRTTFFSICLMRRGSGNRISPSWRRAAVLGALLLMASLPAVSPAAVRGGSGGGSQPGGPAQSGSGSAGGPYDTPGHDRQIVFQFQRSSSAGTRGDG
jgi:hypothetical protein